MTFFLGEREQFAPCTSLPYSPEYWQHSSEYWQHSSEQSLGWFEGMLLISSRIRYNNQLALRCKARFSNQTCSSITREAFFTFLGERVAVVKKKTQGFNMWPQVRRIGSLFFYRFYTKCFHLCRNWVDEQAASIQLTVYSQSSKRVRISWQLGRFSGSAQQSAPNEKQ